MYPSLLSYYGSIYLGFYNVIVSLSIRSGRQDTVTVLFSHTSTRNVERTK